MTKFTANRRFPNPITVTDDPRSHTLALQQVIEALNIGQRRTKEVGSSYVRVSELVDVGLIEIVGNQLKLTNLGSSIAAGGATALEDLTDVDLTGLADGDILYYNSSTLKWEPAAPPSGTSIPYGAGIPIALGWDIVDDFIAYPSSAAGPWPWDTQVSGGTVTFSSGETNAPGIVRLSTGTGVSGAAGILYGTPDGGTTYTPLIVGGGEIVFEARVRLSAPPDGTDQYAARIGLGDECSGAPTDGIYLSTSGTSAVWVAINRTSSVSTSSGGIGVVPTNTWQMLKIVINAAGTSVDFYVDDVLLHTGASGIPATGMSLMASITKAAGTTSRYLEIDAVRCYQLLTTARDFVNGPLDWTGPAGPTGPTGPAATQGRHSIWIGAGAMLPSATGGCQPLANIVSAANQPDITTLNFDPTTQEYAQFSIRMPKSWDEGTLTFAPVWSHAATTTNFGVVWELQAVAISNDDAIATAYGTAQSSTDTGGTTNDLYVGPESSAITVAGTPASEDVVHFRLSRVTGNGSDTLAVDARLHGITLYLTTNADNDA